MLSTRIEKKSQKQSKSRRLEGFARPRLTVLIDALSGEGTHFGLAIRGTLRDSSRIVGYSAVIEDIGVGCSARLQDDDSS